MPSRHAVTSFCGCEQVQRKNHGLGRIFDELTQQITFSTKGAGIISTCKKQHFFTKNSGVDAIFSRAQAETLSPPPPPKPLLSKKEKPAHPFPHNSSKITTVYATTPPVVSNNEYFTAFSHQKHRCCLCLRALN